MAQKEQSGGIDIESKSVDVRGDVTGRDAIKTTSTINEGGVVARIAVVGIIVVSVAAIAFFAFTLFLSKIPEAVPAPALSSAFLAPDCKVGVLCDVIPKYAVGGKAFSWSSPADSVTSDLVQTCARSGALGLAIKYALAGEYDNGGWGVHWANTPDKRIDVAHLGYLSFWIKGTIGNETFQIGLRDTKGTEFKIQSNEFISSISEWTLITIPLSRFKDVSTDSVENVSFSFTRQHRAGSVCIDDIGFQ